MVSFGTNWVMKKLFGIVLAVLFMSASAWAQTAEEYNEQVGNSTDSLHLMAIMWVHACQDIGSSGQDYSGLAPARRNLEKFIKHEIARFKTEPEVEGADDMRKALLAVYEYELELVKEGFMPYEKLKAGASAEEVAHCKENFVSRLKKEQDVLGKFNTARREFVKRNNLEMVKKQDAPKPAFLRSPPKPKPKPAQADASTEDQAALPRQNDAPSPVQSRREPARFPDAGSQPRPTSSGNPNNKMPPKEEPKPKPKDEDGEEEGE